MNNQQQIDALEQYINNIYALIEEDKIKVEQLNITIDKRTELMEQAKKQFFELIRIQRQQQGQEPIVCINPQDAPWPTEEPPEYYPEWDVTYVAQSPDAA